MRFSANLGFLWRELELPAAIRAAGNAGFDAVECHFPYAVPPATVAAALADSGLGMLSLNTRPGDRAAGDHGLAALPGREAEARAAIDEALAYARAIGTPRVHVMAGIADGEKAFRTFTDNLRHATAAAAADGISILIEVLNRYDAPGYFVDSTARARRLFDAVGADNLELMFDCYHLQIMEGDISRRLAEWLPLIGHVQIASVPDRGPPDHGELDYRHVVACLRDLGYARPLGAEYRPPGATGASLGWLEILRGA